MSDLIYVAVANPKGEANHELSEFMQQNQLVSAEKHVIGIPVFINHNTPETLGVPIEPSGIVTNAHVVGQQTQVDLRGVGGLIVTARVVKRDAQADLALLKTDVPPRSFLEMAGSELPLGARVFTIGFPNVDTQGAHAKFTEGSISSLAGWRDDPDDYQISVPLQQGNSGGALVDTRTGLMVGMVTSSLAPSRAASVGYAIKASVLADLIRSTPECASIPPPIDTDAAPERKREANIARAQKASVMVLVK